MTAEDLFDYLKEEIDYIVAPYQLENICGIGPGKVCKDTLHKRKPGYGCCDGCRFHDVDKGCTTTNLACMVVFCDDVKDSMVNEDWITLRGLKTFMRYLNLKPRFSIDEQIAVLKKQADYDITIDDLYEVFRALLR